MQLRIIKAVGTYRLDQRLSMDAYHGRQLIAAGFAVEDTSLEAEAILSTDQTLSAVDIERSRREWEAAHTGERPSGKRRHRRRDSE